MIAAVANKRDEVAAICRRFGVRRLELFGSAARGDFDPDTSDIDVIYEFDDSNDQLLRRFVGLGDALETLFGRPVDLVSDARRNNPYLWASIDRHRKPLYPEDPAIIAPLAISRHRPASTRDDPTPARLFEARRAAEAALEIVQEGASDSLRAELIWGALAWSVLGLDRSLGRAVRDDHCLPEKLRAAHAIIHFQAVAVRIDPHVNRASVQALVRDAFPSLVESISDVLNNTMPAGPRGTAPRRPGV